MNYMPQALEKCRTPESVTIVIFKKDFTAQYWPQLSKTVLPYVKPDFSRWTLEGDESDIVDEDNSIDVINMDIGSSSAETEGGNHLTSVFHWQIGFEVYIFNDENDSQIKAQPYPVSKRQQSHKSYGCNGVPQLRVRRFVHSF